MPLLPTEFIVPTNQTFAEKNGSWMIALLVKMEELEHSFFRVWKYWQVKRSRRLTRIMI
jgi:dimeric dUTPase (all-alpha-NTP-PPase superfamily)